MKTFHLLFFSLMIFSISASAQYGNNYNGMRNNRTPEISHDSSKPSAEDIEKAKAEGIDKIMDKLKDKLSLDELQFIAIKNELTSSNKSIEIVLKREKSEEDKTNDIKAIQEKTDKTINSYLNATQKEKYLKLKEDSMLNKKEDKKKKKEKE